jgi:hypothetical protein
LLCKNHWRFLSKKNVLYYGELEDSLIGRFSGSNRR